MISNLGYGLELLSIFLSLIIIAFRGNLNVKRLFYLNTFVIILSFLTLIYAFVCSDFSIQIVFFNSSTIKPLIYKIAATWASHEGSILLWLTLMSIISSLSIYLLNDNTTLSLQLMILSMIQLLFNSFIFFTSNPFISTNFKPPEGLGLNPVLQDIALSFHPPILYLGFISYIVPFTYSIIILLKGKDEHWLNSNSFVAILKIFKQFSSLALCSLTLGVGLGSWWAYRELGWGGFWFFDPVENISLLPWLSGITLHHCLLSAIKKRHLINWMLSFGILTFLICVFGTFLVRSGLITSIHTFSSIQNRAVYLFILFTLLALPSLFLLINNYLKCSDGSKFSFKEKGIMISNLFIIIAISIILISLIYPIIYELIYKQTITVSYEFFIRNLIPFFIPIILCSAIFISNKFSIHHLYFGIISGFITYIISYKIELGLVAALSIFCSIYSFIQTLKILLIKTNYFQQLLTPSTFSMLTGHFGFALLVLSITLNGLLQQEEEFIGKLGDKVNFDRFNVDLKNIKYSESNNYYRQIAEFWLTDSNNNITILKPENRFYPIEKSLSVESDIYSYLTYDLYAVLSRIDGELIYAQIYYRPMMSFIWLSIFIISCGFIVSMIDSKKHYKII